MQLLAAFRFLTVIPFWRKKEFTPAQIGGSAAFFPLVGLAIGLILGLLAWALGFILPSMLISALLILVMVAVTGGFHLDGLADTCDGLGGHTPEQRLEIMKDSHTGSFGIIGVALVLLLQFAALSSIPRFYLPFVVLVVPVIGRFLMAYAVYTFPYARASGLGAVFKEKIRWQHLLIAVIITVAVSVGVGRLAGLAALLAAWLAAWTLAVFLKRKLGGLTGDTYGAVNEVGQVVVLLVAVLLLRNHWLVWN